MPKSPDPDEVRAALDPVWFNAYWVKNALELYEGVSKHAEQLNTNYGHFFGLAQKFSLDSAVLGISKLFDTGNTRYEKDTVPALFAYMRSHFTDAYTVRLKIETLTALGMTEDQSNRYAGELRTAFAETKDNFLNAIETLMPNIKTNDALGRLVTARNKIIAHQEHLSDALKEELKYLPSLADMEKLNKWSIDFCLLSINLLTPNVTLIPNGASARMAALNVAAKLLERNFDRVGDAAVAAERKAFFSRI